MTGVKRKICSIILLVMFATVVLATLSACNLSDLKNGISIHKDGVYYTVYVLKRYAVAHGFDKNISGSVYEIPSRVKYKAIRYPVRELSPSGDTNYKLVRDNGVVTELIVPETMAELKLSRYAYAELENLQKITVNTANSTYMSVDGVVYSKDLSTLVFYPSAKVGNNLVLPKQTSSINDYLSGKKNLSTIEVEEGNTSYSAKDGVLFTADGKEMLCYPLNKKDSTYVIPQSCTVLNTFRLDANAHLKYLEVEEGNTVFATFQGDLYSHNYSILLYRPHGNNMEVLELAENITTVGLGMLDKVKYLYVPSGLERIVFETSNRYEDVNVSNPIADVAHVYFESSELPIFLRYTNFTGSVQFGVTREQFQADVEALQSAGEQL